METNQTFGHNTVGLVKWENLSHVINLKSKATVRISNKPN